MTDLQTRVHWIASGISSGILLSHLGVQRRKYDYSVLDYLESALDIEYIVDKRGYFKGARVLVSSSANSGNATVWINTKTLTVEGGQGTEYAEVGFDDQIGLNDALRFLFGLTMRRIAE